MKSVIDRGTSRRHFLSDILCETTEGMQEGLLAKDSFNDTRRCQDRQVPSQDCSSNNWSERRTFCVLRRSSQGNRWRSRFTILIESLPFFSISFCPLFEQDRHFWKDVLRSLRRSRSFFFFLTYKVKSLKSHTGKGRTKNIILIHMVSSLGIYLTLGYIHCLMSSRQERDCSRRDGEKTKNLTQQLERWRQLHDNSQENRKEVFCVCVLQVCFLVSKLRLLSPK